MQFRVCPPFLVAILCLTGASPAAAQRAPPLAPADDAAVKAAAGVWDIEIPTKDVTARGRRCRLQLNLKAGSAPKAAPELALGMLPVCRMTFQALGPATHWALSGEGHLLLRTADNKTVADFARDGDGPMRGRLGPDAVTLTPASGRYPDPAKIAAKLAALSPRKQEPAAVKKLQPAPPVDKMPGLYAMMRFAGREVCRLVLEAKPGTKQGFSTARFSGSCPDVGLVAFDPIGWQLVGNRLKLLARKGHDLSLVFEPDGAWRKDPPTGSTLILKKKPQ